MPDDTKIFCGLEQSKEFMDFGIRAEQKNQKIVEFEAKYREMRKNIEYSVPSVLREEKEYNVFLRCLKPEIQKFLGAKDALKVICIYR